MNVGKTASFVKGSSLKYIQDAEIIANQKYRRPTLKENLVYPRGTFIFAQKLKMD